MTFYQVLKEEGNKRIVNFTDIRLHFCKGEFVTWGGILASVVDNTQTNEGRRIYKFLVPAHELEMEACSEDLKPAPIQPAPKAPIKPATVPIILALLNI